MKSTYSVPPLTVVLAAVSAACLLVGASGCQESSAPGAATASTAAAPAVGDSADAAQARGDDVAAADPPPADPTNAKTATASSAGQTNQPPRTLSISFDDIKFEMKKEQPFVRTMLTDKIESYAGRTIRIRGFILPSFKQDGLTEFVLVRDNMECCFGPGAALYDCIMVRMQPGKSTSFSVRPVTVEGTMSIAQWKDFEDVTRAIYHLEGHKVF